MRATEPWFLRNGLPYFVPERARRGSTGAAAATIVPLASVSALAAVAAGVGLGLARRATLASAPPA